MSRFCTLPAPIRMTAFSYISPKRRCSLQVTHFLPIAIPSWGTVTSQAGHRLHLNPERRQDHSWAWTDLGKKNVDDMKAYLLAFDKKAGKLCAKLIDIEYRAAEIKKPVPRRAQADFLIMGSIQAKYLKK